jgi:hypothetical protein
MNTFYGKSVNTMTFNELTLLSVDIQLSSFDKVNNIPTMVLEQSLLIREGLMYKCINDGGDYSRERFVHDFNGTRPNEIEGGYDEFIEITNYLSLN